jgi:hypothetical protein
MADFSDSDGHSDEWPDSLVNGHVNSAGCNSSEVTDLPLESSAPASVLFSREPSRQSFPVLSEEAGHPAVFR